ncbi:hypothetical protein RHS02_07893, partial [Rhizoctonia solani]
MGTRIWDRGYNLILAVPARPTSSPSLLFLNLQGPGEDSPRPVFTFEPQQSSVLRIVITSETRSLSTFVFTSGDKWNSHTTPRLYDFPITLLALEVLYLEDLFKDLLDLILESTALGPHHTTLHITGKCVRTYPPRDNEVLGFHDSKLGNFKIDTLMIGHDLGGHGPALRPLLEMLPTIKTLYMDCLTLTPSNLRPLINHAGPGKPAVNFPRLTKLYIGQSFFPDISGLHSLQEVVASHPIVGLGLGMGLREFTEARDTLRHMPDPRKQMRISGFN